MKKLILLLILLQLFLIGCGGSKGVKPQNTYLVTVTVNVVDEKTNNAVPGATTVIENGAVGETDSNGCTVFQGVKGNQSYVFVSSAPNYGVNRHTQEIGQDNANITNKLSKELGTITGIVVNEAEAPMEASVRLVQLNQTTTSDPTTGAFKFENVYVSDDPYTVEVSKTGFVTSTIGSLKVTPVAKNIDTGKIVVYTSPGELRGNVKDPSTGLGVADALIQIVECNQTCQTDQFGDYSNTEVLPGTYTVKYTHTNYGSVTKTGVQIRGGKPTVVNVTLTVKPGTIFGVIRNSLNAVVPGVTVTVVGTSCSAISSTDGSFRIEAPPGTYTVTLTHPLYNSKSVSANITSGKETDLGDIVLPSAAGSIKGYIASPGCTITLIQTGDQQYFGNAANFTFSSIMAGNYIIKVERNDYASIFKPVTVQSGSVADIGSISANTYKVGAPNYGAGLSSLSASVLSDSSGNEFTSSFTVSYTQNITFNYHAGTSYSTVGSSGQTLSATASVWITNSGGGVVWSNDSAPGSVTLSLAGTYVLHARGQTSSTQYQGSTFTHSNTGSISGSYYSDNKCPKINLSQTWGSRSLSYSVTISAEDSTLNSLGYVLSATTSQPDSSEYHAIANGASITISSSGIWYLHVRAGDVAGNVGYICEGPFIVDALNASSKASRKAK